jgi:hypothetical protein
MDLLTHIFLPLVALYVLKREAFNPPYYFFFALFGILPDFDKLIGMSGLLHSLVTLVPLILVILLFEKLVKGTSMYTGIIAFFIGSHLVLDILDGGPVPFFYPFIKAGIGLEFPLLIAFHSFSFSFCNMPFQLTYAVPNSGFNTYELLSGFGMASLLLFAVVYLGMRKYRGKGKVNAISMTNSRKSF